MGQSHLQFEVLRVLVALLVDYFSKQEGMVRIGGEMTFLLDPADPKKKLMPDLYVLEDEPQGGPKVPSWKPWEHEGKVPTLALEVVSDAYEKDYTPEEMPQRYQELGVRELVRYDPDFSGHPRSKRARALLTHFVRDEAGVLQERPVDGELVQLCTYPLWLLHRPPYYLRIATGPGPGRLVLWPSTEEYAQRAQREAERARRAEEKRQYVEEERQRIEEENRLLRAELARLRGEAP